MKFNIITNIQNGAGLEADYKLLRDFLVARGHSVTGIQFNTSIQAVQSDVNIFIETVEDRFFCFAREQWIVPNPEWFQDAWYGYLGRPDVKLILCKTQDAARIFSGRGFDSKTRYIGFCSIDLYDPSIPKTRAFLHVAGNSQAKNTRAVIDCWKNCHIREDLVIVSRYFHDAAPNTHFILRASPQQMKDLMNRAMFHLCISEYEGFGHALHEAMGCGGIVITTSRPPMSEFGCPSQLLVEPVTFRRFNQAPMHVTDAGHISSAVRRALDLDSAQTTALSTEARLRFEQDNREFEERFQMILSEVEKSIS